MSNVIKSTKNYEMFELHEFNRNVENISILETLMRKYGWIDGFPMFVVRQKDGRLIVYDGHHRLEVAKKLGIAAKYVVWEDVGISLPDLILSVQKWTVEQALASHIRAKHPAYIAIKEYMQETGIALGVSSSLLAGESAGSGNKSKAIISGKYKLGDQSHANKVKDIVLHMKACGISFATHSYFLQALSKALWVVEFDIARFKHKISSHASFFSKRPTVNDYLDEIETIYNRQSRERLLLSFLAKEKGKLRSKTFGKAIGTGL